MGGLPLLITNPTLRGALAWLFSLKSTILILTVALSIVIFRFFCRVLCPLGAIYSLFNPICFYQLRLNRDVCTGCGACARVCKLGVNPASKPNALECVRCGECVSICPAGALSAGFGEHRCAKTRVTQ